MVIIDKTANIHIQANIYHIYFYGSVLPYSGLFFSRFIICLQISWFYFFNGWVISYCINVPLFLYWFSCWGMSRLFPIYECFEKSSNEHGWVSVSVVQWSILGIYDQEWWHHGILSRSIPIFLRSHHTDFHCNCKGFTPTCNRWVFPLLHILASKSYHLFYWSWPSQWCKEKSQSNFNLYFPDD